MHVTESQDNNLGFRHCWIQGERCDQNPFTLGALVPLQPPLPSQSQRGWRELPRLYPCRPILGVRWGRGCRQQLFPQPPNRCPGLSSLVQLKCCALCEPVPTARGHGYAGEFGPKPPMLLSCYPVYLPPLAFPVP